jgi:hypothetical protein
MADRTWLVVKFSRELRRFLSEPLLKRGNRLRAIVESTADFRQCLPGRKIVDMPSCLKDIAVDFERDCSAEDYDPDRWR